MTYDIDLTRPSDEVIESRKMRRNFLAGGLVVAIGLGYLIQNDPLGRVVDEVYSARQSQEMPIQEVSGTNIYKIPQGVDLGTYCDSKFKADEIQEVLPHQYQGCLEAVIDEGEKRNLP